MFLKGSADLYMKLWATKHLISGCSLHPISSFHVLSEIMAVTQRGEPSCTLSVCTGWLTPACSCWFSRHPSAAPATTATCVRCAPGSQAGGARGTGSARMGCRAAGSAGAWRAFTAPPARCVKWDGSEPTANQVTPAAEAAWLCQTACKCRKVATSQLSGGVVGEQKDAKTLRQANGCQGSERDSRSEHLWPARGMVPFCILKPSMCCAVLLFLLPPKLQQAQTGDLLLGFLAWQ